MALAMLKESGKGRFIPLGVVFCAIDSAKLLLGNDV